MQPPPKQRVFWKTIVAVGKQHASCKLIYQVTLCGRLERIFHNFSFKIVQSNVLKSGISKDV